MVLDPQQCLRSTSSRFLPHSNSANGDRKGFPQGEPLVFRPNPTASVIDWVVVLSTLVSSLSLAIAIILALPTCAPARKRKLRRRRRQPRNCIQESCRFHLLNTALSPLSSLTLPEHDSPLVRVEFFRKLGVFEMAEVHEGYEKNRSSVPLALLNYF